MFREVTRRLLRAARPFVLGLALSIGLSAPAPASLPPMQNRPVLEMRVEENARAPSRTLDLSSILSRATLPEAPILMYHHVDRSEDRFTVSPSRLWGHLDHLRTHGYDLVTFDEYARGARHVRRPAVLTFDDSTEDQYRILPDGRIDPACAVGVLERYKERHPDYRVTATFFVNMTTLKGLPTFEQPGMERQKLRFLVDKGYEVGAHGDRHRDFKRLTVDETRADLERFLARSHDLLPGYAIRSFAYPYGSLPPESNQRVVESYFPSTAHAWGGIAEGKRVNIARIETGPRTVLARYAPDSPALDVSSPSTIPHSAIPPSTLHLSTIPRIEFKERTARAAPLAQGRDDAPIAMLSAHAPLVEESASSIAATAPVALPPPVRAPQPIAPIAAHASALERTVIDHPPAPELPAILPPRIEPPVYTYGQMMRDLGKVIEKTLAVITEMRAYLSVRYDLPVRDARR